MTVNGISMEKMDWSGALGALNNINGVTAEKDGDTIRITRTGEGKTSSVTLSIPQLDDAEVFSTAELQKLVDNFDNLRANPAFPVTETERQAFVDALNTAFDKVMATDPKTVDDVLGPKRGASKALFDVYGIFKLLIMVAQLQRNALRDVRQAENAAVQKAILNQAEEQLIAAEAGLIGGLVTCAIQLGMQGGVLVAKGVKFLKQKVLGEVSGVSAAETNLRTAKLTGNADAAAKNLSRLGELAGDGKGAIDGKLTSDAFKGKVEQLTEALKANERLSENLGGLDDLRNQKTELTGRQAELAKQLGEAQKANAGPEAQKEIQGQLDDCNKQLNDVGAKIEFKEKLVGKEGNGGEIGELRNELGKLQDEYCKNADTIEGEYKQKFDAARNEYREAIKGGDKATIKDAKAKFETAQREYEYAHAAGIEGKISFGGISRSDAAKTFGAIDSQKLESARQNLALDPEYRQLEHEQGMLTVYEGMIQAAGQALQNAIQQFSQILQAKAHALGAKEQEARNELDQINDLFANCQKLLEAVLQAMMAVIQAESQSVDNAIAGLRG